MADEANETGSLNNYKMENSSGLLRCAELKFDTLNRMDKDTITLLFGDKAGNICADGRERKGKIIIMHERGLRAYRDSSSTHSITFENYYVNDNKVNGTKTVTRMRNATGHIIWKVEVNGSIVLANGGGTITWTSIRKRELLAGEQNGLINWNQAKWAVTGTAIGTTANGSTYSANIDSALIRDMSCPIGLKRHFTKGVLTFTPAGKLPRIINYGNGDCDDKATVTIKDKTYNITLR